MVSLLKLAEITEEGVKFQSPHDGQEMLLTPEKSTEIQNSIGADIIMQLDDVVSSVTTGKNVKTIMCSWINRLLKWLPIVKQLPISDDRITVNCHLGDPHYNTHPIIMTLLLHHDHLLL